MRYLLPVVALVAGCATPEERADRDIAAHAPYCDRMGYQRDSDAWRSCIQQQASERRARASEAARRGQDTQKAMQESFRKSQ